MAARLSTRDDYADLLDKYDTWLFDCDGVLWEGDRLIDGATEVLGILRRQSTLSSSCISGYWDLRVADHDGLTREVGFVRDEQCNEVKEEL